MKVAVFVWVAAAAAAVSCVAGQSVTIPEGVFTATSPGIRYEQDGPAEATLCALHFNINTKLEGVAAGQYNVDITTKTNGKWVYENRDVQVTAGSKVYYWVLCIVNGAGYQQLNREYTVGGGGPTTAAPTTTKPTTRATTTRATTAKPTTTPTPVRTRPTVSLVTLPACSDIELPGNESEPVACNNGSVIVDPNDSCGCICACKANEVVPDDDDEDEDLNKPHIPQLKKCTSYPCLILEDNFDTLNFDLWKHEITAGGGGNWEFQYYTNNRSNSYVKDGYLYITPTLTSDKYGEEFLTKGQLDIWGNGPSHCTGNAFYGCFRAGTPSNLINPLQSARLRTWESFSVKYGKVEVEAKMPAGDWIWPAIWLLPKDEEFGIWPASGEIDIIESRGNANLRDPSGKSLGVDSMGSTLHWGPYWPVNGWEKTHVTKNAQSGTFATDFHKYGVEWDEDHLSFYLDDEEILNVNPQRDGYDGFWSFGEFETKVPGSTNPWVNAHKMAPFDKEYYIILNVAVGGTNGFFGDDWVNGNGAKPWRNTSPTAFAEFWNGRSQWMPTWKEGETSMVVNYVKVWQTRPDDE